MKKIWENIKLGATMVIIGALLLYIATILFMPELTVKIFGFQPYTVYTESMEPYIMVNDVVVVKKFNMDEAEVGDIITFYADIDYNGTEEVVTHYIYSIEGEGDDIIIRTNRHYENEDDIVPDTWLITEDDVLGSYSFHIQYLGYVIGFIKSWYGLAVIGINVVLFTTIKIVNKRMKAKEAQEEQKQQEDQNQKAQEPKEKPQE